VAAPLLWPSLAAKDNWYKSDGRIGEYPIDNRVLNQIGITLSPPANTYILARATLPVNYATFSSSGHLRDHVQHANAVGGVVLRGSGVRRRITSLLL